MRQKNASGASNNQRRIADIHLALKTTSVVLIEISAFGALLGFLANASFGMLHGEWVVLGVVVAWLLFSPFIFRVWFTYHDGIIVDVGNDRLSSPASDVESSLLEIITFRRFFNHGRTESLHLSSVEAAMNETQTSKGRYAINLAGSFGSRQLAFDSKQKRDEFRAAVEWGLKQLHVRFRKDNNIDTGVFGG